LSTGANRWRVAAHIGAAVDDMPPRSAGHDHGVDLGDDVVRMLRGGELETEHRLAWCVVGPAGVVASSGPDAASLPVFARSSTKPFQALPAVRARVLGRLGLGDRHLAVACASHGGGPEHQRAVREVLAAADVGEELLACGPLAPRDPSLVRVAPTRVVNNCSGKHALALALCRVKGWPVEGYHHEDHPVQAAMRVAVGAATGGLAAGEAIDGCGMRTYRMPLAGLAGAFAGLAGGTGGPALARVRTAMRAHPALVGFGGAVDTELMAAEPGLVAKIGAAGVIGIGLPDGRGLALKVVDGSARALDAGAVHVARRVLGLRATSPALDALAAGTERNSRGDEVGRVEVALDRRRLLAAVP
jgi:L-asparaginase II